MIEPRLARHLLGRLRRAAMVAAVERAVDADLLHVSFHVIDGREVKMFAVGEAASGRSAADILRLLARQSGQAIGRGDRDVVGRDRGSSIRSLPRDVREAMEAEARDRGNRDAEARDARRAGDGEESRTHANAASTGGDPATWRVPDLVRLVRSTAEPPKADEVATLMLVAQAIGTTAPPLEMTRELLNVANPRLAERVNARLEASYAKARSLIRDSADAVRHLADALLARDTLEGPELDAELVEVRTLMAARSDPPPDPESGNDGGGAAREEVRNLPLRR